MYLALVPCESVVWQQPPAKGCPGGQELAVCAQGCLSVSNSFEMTACFVKVT